MNESVTEPVEKQVEAVLSKFMTDWNKKQEKRGDDFYIHDIIDAKEILGKPEMNTLYFHIDFGSADINALTALFKHLSKGNFQIKKIVLE
jgi:hypothetical protein